MESYQSLLIKRLEFSFNDDNWFDKLKYKKNKSFVGYVDIKAIDPYVAMEQAYNVLNIFVKFYRVISNHRKSIVSNSGMVRRVADDTCMYLPVTSRGYKSIEVEPKTDLRTVIDNAVLGCQSKGALTYSHVNKAINLHNMALSQLDLNDGFVNLWSVLEVVSRDSKEESKIKSVVDSILPILQNDFFIKYFRSLCDDIKTAINRTDYQNLLRCINQEGSPEYKIACWVFLEEYENLREEVFQLLVLHPNIRNRVYKLYKLRKDKKEVFKIASMYGERVKWHLYRLYRVRNDIVHAGKSTKNIALLGEHLHIYCDGIINEIIMKLACVSYND